MKELLFSSLGALIIGIIVGRFLRLKRRHYGMSVPRAGSTHPNVSPTAVAVDDVGFLRPDQVDWSRVRTESQKDEWDWKREHNLLDGDEPWS